MNIYKASLDGHEGTTVGIVVSKFNGQVTANLLQGALEGLKAHGVQEEAISVAYVPGAVEIPLIAQKLAESGEVDAVIAIGAVIRGETSHYDYVCQQVSNGVQKVALETGVPVVFSVLTTDTDEQAMARAGRGKDNKGYEGAVAALEMVSLIEQLPMDMSWLEEDDYEYDEDCCEEDECCEDDECCEEDCECESEEEAEEEETAKGRS